MARATQPSATRAAAPGTESSRKLLGVLLCFSGRRPTWSVAELAAELDLTQSSVYRYVGLLRDTGLIEPAPDSRYRVTDRVLTLSDALAADRSALVEASLPVMTELRDVIGETVLLARRSEESAYCVERVESRHPVRLQFDRGQPMALHSGSMPRVLLAYMPDSERRRYLARVRPTLPPERLAMISDEALRRTAEDGCGESFEEIDEGIWGTAAAVRRGHEIVAVIGTAGPVYRIDAAARSRIRNLVNEGAARISARLEPSAV